MSPPTWGGGWHVNELEDEDTERKCYSNTCFDCFPPSRAQQSFMTFLHCEGLGPVKSVTWLQTHTSQRYCAMKNFSRIKFHQFYGIDRAATASWLGIHSNLRDFPHVLDPKRRKQRRRKYQAILQQRS